MCGGRPGVRRGPRHRYPSRLAPVAVLAAVARQPGLIAASLASRALASHHVAVSPRPVVLVGCGGRALAWPVAQVKEALQAAARGQPVRAVFHGGARGADQLIGQAAACLGCAVVAWPAQWRQFGPAAGPLRNRRMVAEAGALAAGLGGVLVVVAFPGGRGTASCIHEARRWGRLSGGAFRLEVVHLAQGSIGPA